MKKFIFFGDNLPNYPRNINLKKLFGQLGTVNVIKSHQKEFCNSWRRLLPNIIKIVFDSFRNISDVDYVVILFPDHLDVISAYLAKKIYRKHYKIIYDPLISQYDTYLYNKPVTTERSLLSKMLRICDRVPMLLADIILIDADSNADYLSNLLNIDRDKFKKHLIGASIEHFYPRDEPKSFWNEQLKIIWYGRVSKLHDMETILSAIELLKNEDIYFTLIADLRRYNGIESDKVEVIEWIGPHDISLIELRNYAWQHHICLGCFGNTKKAECVVINKEYEALAMRKALITRIGPKEFLRSGYNCIMVPPENPEALAETILKLYKDKDLLEKIANNGYKDFILNCSEEVLLKNLESTLTKKRV